MAIHPTAIVDKQAEIDPTAEIGPYAVIEGPVTIRAGTRVYPNAYISGWTEIGQGCEIHPGAVIGHLPQDFHFHPCRSYCRIGDGTIVREFASIHRGTQPESATILGKGCFILGYSHIGHNCVLGDGVKLYNMAACSGHVDVGEKAVISAYSGIHQFVRIGRYVMIGGLSRITMDVAPFFMCVRESECVGVNVVGMRRGGFGREHIAEARQAYKLLYRSGMSFRKAAESLAEMVKTDVGRQIVEFLGCPSRRGFAGPPMHRRVGAEPADAPGDSGDLKDLAEGD